MLKRGYSTATRFNDKINREVWRTGTIVSATNGRFAVEYGGEKGKPQESRIEEARLRPRHTIRQKAAAKVRFVGETLSRVNSTGDRSRRHEEGFCTKLLQHQMSVFA